MPELPAEIIAMGLLTEWLEEKSSGESGMSWTFTDNEVTTVPDGYYAVVRVELRKLGGEPKERELRHCTDCGESHEVGKPCPYKRVKEKPQSE